jgi:hypothetical protein
MSKKSTAQWLDGVHLGPVITVKRCEVVVPTPLHGARLEQHEEAYEILQLAFDHAHLLAEQTPEGKYAVLDRSSVPFTPTPETIDLQMIRLSGPARAALCLT